MDFAVLDAQWTPHFERVGDLLAVATSSEMVEFYRMKVMDDHVELVNSSWLVTDLEDSQPVMVLSLAWHPWLPDVLGVTLSNGDIPICQCEGGDVWDEEPMYNTQIVHRHELEAWTLAFSGAGDTTNVLSGGDDAVLQYSRVKGMEDLTFTWKDRGLHQAGVTAILPLTPDLIVTGSYDDHIRLISCPQGARRQVIAEQNLGGGVWRLKMLSPASELPQSEGVGSANTAGIMLPERFVCPGNPSRFPRLSAFSIIHRKLWYINDAI